MKKSEKIGIAIVVVLAIILVSVLLSGNKGNTKKDYCNGLCLPSGPETWSLMGEPVGEDNNNNFPTKDECISACLLKK